MYKLFPGALYSEVHPLSRKDLSQKLRAQTDLRLCLTNQDGSSQDVNHAEADVGGYVDAGIGEAVILIQLISSSTCSLPVTVKNKFREGTRSKCHQE